MTGEQQEFKAALTEAARKALACRTADIEARHYQSMTEPDDDDCDDGTLDFGQLIKNTDINTP